MGLGGGCGGGITGGMGFQTKEHGGWVEVCEQENCDVRDVRDITTRIIFQERFEKVMQKRISRSVLELRRSTSNHVKNITSVTRHRE